MGGTVVMRGGGGRGKTCALGLGLAGAIAFGFSNVFLTAETPRKAQEVFRFVLKGFDVMGWKEEEEYEVVVQEGGKEGGSGRSGTGPAGSKGGREGGKAPVILRINVFRGHRQTVQFIYPDDGGRLEQAEVLAIDDAASLPPSLVKNLLGPYLTFIAIEEGGEGGAGPAAVGELMARVKAQASSTAGEVAAAAAAEVRGSQTKKGERQVHEERWRKAAEAVSALGAGRRSVVEVGMEEPVLWRGKDPLERWVGRMGGVGGREGGGGVGLRFGTPAPWECELFYVERRTLLSGHAMTELLLERVMFVYGAWARRREGGWVGEVGREGEHLLVLLGPEAEEQGERGGLPDILAVVHVREVVEEEEGGREGRRGGGRVELVNVEKHPDVMSMGYGGRAVQQLGRYLKGDIGSFAAAAKEEEEEEEKALTRVVDSPPQPRQTLPPVLTSLEEKGPLWACCNSSSSSSSSSSNNTPTLPPRVAVVHNVPTSPSWWLTFWRRAGFRPIAMTAPSKQEEGEEGREEGHGYDQAPTVTMALGLWEGGRGGDDELLAQMEEFQLRVLRLLPSVYAGLGAFTALGLVQGQQQQVLAS